MTTYGAVEIDSREYYDGGYSWHIMYDIYRYEDGKATKVMSNIKDSDVTDVITKLKESD